MSRRPTSPLDAEFAARGLVRMNRAARRLHIPCADLLAHVDSGRVKSATVAWGSDGSQQKRGITENEVRKLHDAMWPHCGECAASVPS